LSETSLIVVAEACCGTGSLALALRQRGVEVYALDLAPRMLAQAAARFAQAGLSPARLVQGDVTRLWGEAKAAGVTVTASGDRSVAIGGNVSGSVIVTGHRNFGRFHYPT
jgi:ubiquinone/menaquinone biosynthesis C-methylase UbiE